MKYIIIDLFEGIKFSELSECGWDIVATALLIIAGVYWLGLSDYGVFFQLSGFVGYFAAAALCVKKTSWGRKFIESLKGEDEE
jgi:hypothetical protein